MKEGFWEWKLIFQVAPRFLLLQAGCFLTTLPPVSAGRLVMHNLALLVVAGLRVCLLVCCSLALRFVQSARVQQGKHCQSFTSLKVLG
jgi:hypothetical protein